MAKSSDTNFVPEGTILVFGSWACTTDKSGRFSSHFIIPKAPEAKPDNQPAETNNVTELGGNLAPPEVDSEAAENASTPTHPQESGESDANSNSKNFQLSETLGKYVAYLKSIKRHKIVNSKLLDEVDRVSRSIEGCIKLAESALSSSKTHGTPGQVTSSLGSIKLIIRSPTALT